MYECIYVTLALARVCVCGRVGVGGVVVKHRMYIWNTDISINYFMELTDTRR